MHADGFATPESESGTDASFAALGVPAPLVEVLNGQGITEPFPVQAATLPDALAGRDILGRARTGSGKTLGFSLPLVSRLAGRAARSARPLGLVLVPTRELATQVMEVLKPLARAEGLWVTTIYGGVAYGPQVSALQRGTDIVVATPGRLADLIGQGECDLSEVEITVIDEADQMADLGFLPIVRRLLETTPEDGQRMLFSATLDAAVDVLARRFLHDPVSHSVDENSSPAELEHYVLSIEPSTRVAVLTTLAGGQKRSLVFTRTKHGAERLARQLTTAGIPAAELHGNLRQGARSRNLAAFSTGVARVMVATDIAARGIHIDGIDLVIHADPPAEHKAYVHRSGRTARGGADGVVVTLQTRAQARDVAAMMRKAAITPHAAVEVTPESAVLTEIAGQPAPRVSVTGKVSELVQPEDRLAKGDRPGAGGPGRPRRDRDRGRDRRRDRKPRGDAFRDRGEQGGAARHDRDASGERAERPARRERPAPADRREESRDRGERGGFRDRNERPGRFDRRDESRRADGPPRDRYAGGRGNEQPERNDRGDRDRGDRRSGDGYRGSDNRGSGSQGYGDRQGRGPGRDNRGGTRAERGSGNDWWPHSGGQARPGSRRPGSSWNRDERGREGGYRGERSQSAGRPGGPARQPGSTGGRSSAGKRRSPGQGRHF